MRYNGLIAPPHQRKKRSRECYIGEVERTGPRTAQSAQAYAGTLAIASQPAMALEHCRASRAVEVDALLASSHHGGQQPLRDGLDHCSKEVLHPCPEADSDELPLLGHCAPPAYQPQRPGQWHDDKDARPADGGIRRQEIAHAALLLQ